MATLSSRQPAASSGPTPQSVIDAAQPAVNIVLWLSTMLVFHDDHPMTVIGAREILEEALECLMLPDFVVIPIPGITTKFLHFEVAVKPITGAAFVFFRTQFAIV